MIPAITAFWTGLPKPVREALTWIGVVILFIFLGKAYIKAKNKEAVEKERAKQRERAAIEAAKIETKRREISEERTDAVTHAEQTARDHVVSSSPDELRARDPDLYAIVYGGAGSRSGETESR
jgi:type II secretory pathway component PulM